MYLRKLQLSDAPLMLAWMHDQNVTEHLRADFTSKTIEDAEHFITESQKEFDDNQSDVRGDIHLAIATDEDEYMGTVSLRNIANGSAEFAITVRAEAMGRGYSWFGMESILEKAFNEYGLESVYWCVSRDNARALLNGSKPTPRQNTAEYLPSIPDPHNQTLKTAIQSSQDYNQQPVSDF